MIQMHFEESKSEPVTNEFIIGYLLGELIFSANHNSMPTLDHEPPCCGVPIKISEEDLVEYNRLHDIWFDHFMEEQKKYKWGLVPNSKEDPKWKEYRTFAHSLQHKYLPNPWRWHLPEMWFGLKWTEEVKEGLVSSLWNSDGCTYNLNTMTYVDDPEHYNAYIEFKLDEL